MVKIIPDYFVKKEKEGKGEGRKRRNPSAVTGWFMFCAYLEGQS